MKRTIFVVFLAVMALMLVSTTSFAKVTGTCSLCHTMHNSQNNVEVVATLGTNLTKGDCGYCHVDSGTVLKDVTATAGNAGAFDPAAAPANVHNVTEVTWATAEADNTAAPGGTYLTADLGCASCHTTDVDSGHHKTIDYILGAGSTVTKTMYTTGTGGMSEFCGGCHTDFHSTQGSAGAWTRHPTDVIIPTTWTLGTDTNVAYAYADAAGQTANEHQVSCVSCHRAHGSDQADLLRFAMSDAGSAGDTGCLHCHSGQR